MWWKDKCQSVCVCVWCALPLRFANVRLSPCSSLFLSHEPGAPRECWECKPLMSDGDSLLEKQSDGRRWWERARCLTFTLQIQHQPLISTVTSQKEDFPLWIIIQLNSLINQFMPRSLGNWGWYLFSVWAGHACLSYKSQKKQKEEGRTDSESGK